MLLQLPEVLKGIHYYEGVSLILWILAVIILFSAFILFLNKALRSDVKETRFGYLSMANFSLFFGLCRLFYLFSVYDPPNYILHVVLGYLFTSIALLFIIYEVETQVITQTKKLFTVITLIMVIISIITVIGLTTRDLALLLMYLLMPLSTGILAIMYVYFISKSSGKIRKKAIFILIAIMLVFFAHLLDTETFISLTYPIIPLELPPLMMCSGMILYIYANIFYKIK